MQGGRQLTSVLERGPGTEQRLTRILTVCLRTHSLTRTNTYTYSSPLPATTNHWTISYNPSPASAAAFNIQTNCPSSSARCRKRHKAKADSWAGPWGWIWSGGSLSVAPRNRTIMSWLLSACQPALRCSSQLFFAKEISGIAEALRSHSIRQMGIFGFCPMFSSLILFLYWFIGVE